MLGNMAGRKKKSICKANILTATLRVRHSIDPFLEACSTHPLPSLSSKGENRRSCRAKSSHVLLPCTRCNPSVAFRAMQKLIGIPGWILGVPSKVQSEDLSYVSRKLKEGAERSLGGSSACHTSMRTWVWAPEAMWKGLPGGVHL